MYVGSTDERGLFYLLFDLVSESLAEAVAGYGRSIRVALRADGSAEVADDGRPMPEVERAFTRSGYGRGDDNPYLTAHGLQDFGYMVANALSERLSVVARSDGSTYQHSFRSGDTHAVVQSGGPPGARGLTVTFRPDPLIFGDAQFDASAVRYRLRQLAFLHCGVRITFTDETSGTHDEFEYADGIREYVKLLNEHRQLLHADVIMLHGEEQGVRYEIGLQWCAEADEMQIGFANHYHPPHGGTHMRGLRAGAAAGVSDFIRQKGPMPEQLRSDDIRAGLTAVVSVWLREPMYMGATRSHLGNPEAETVVESAVRRGVCEFFEANRAVADRVIRAAIEARDLRVEAKRIRTGE
jgi:DNA gyrase/topoisomerase IV subunit B